MQNLLLFYILSSLIQLRGDNPCTEVAQDSVPGQFVNQMITSLNLTGSQALAISEIQEASYPELETRSSQLQVLRTELLDSLRSALEDGVLSEEEKSLLKSRRETILSGVLEQKEIVAHSAQLIRDQLTSLQIETLDHFKADIQVPEESIAAGKDALAAFNQILQAYAITGNLNPLLVNQFKKSMDAFLETVYVPDWLLDKIEYWKVYFENHQPEKFISPTFSRISVTKALWILKSIQAFDFSKLGTIQERPMYQLFVRDLVMDMALLSPLSHCRLAESGK